MLQAGDRLRVISQPGGMDCTIEVLMELLAPILKRGGGLQGLFNINVVTGDDEHQPDAAAGGA
jgi:hypothetical protein